MIRNRKLHYPQVFVLFYLVLFMCSDLFAQSRKMNAGNSLTEEMTQRKQDMTQTHPQMSEVGGIIIPSKINAYKFIKVETSGLYAGNKFCVEQNAIGLNALITKLSSYGIPILHDNGDITNECDILFCYLGQSPDSRYAMTTAQANVFFENCHNSIILNIRNIKLAGDFKLMGLLSKAPEEYYKNLFDAMFQDFGSYHYAYNSPAQTEKFNAVTTQITPVQTITTNTNQVNVEQPKTTTKAPVVSDVDVNIPFGAKPNANRFALIIGNEDYHSNQSGLRAEADVEFAAHDAATFKEYAIKVLGVPEDNMIFITNAKLVEMNRSVEKLSLLTKATGGDAEIFFYYAGHGYPDEITKEAYIIPVDVSGADLKYALKLKEIYNTLTAFQSKRVTIFMDACFSGGAREAPLLANRGIKIKPKETTLSGNEVVFCATSNDQTAMAYKAKGHGMFTYFLLKKLQETKGDVAYGELYESLQKQVGVKSILENSIEQTPTMVTAPGLGESWKQWRMK